MKHAHFILGLTMLCVAGTVAAYIVMQPAGELAAAPDAGQAGPFRGAAGAGSSAKSEPLRMAVLIGGVEAPNHDPVLIERAELVETAAHKRLAELTAQLRLTRKQQAQIFPLLARCSPHYDDSLEITGRSGRVLVAALTRREADREIYDLLDAGQQGDLDLAEAEKDLWWSSVIARLERDLRNSTQSSSPPDAADPPPPASAPPGHQRGNLFDPSNN